MYITLLGKGTELQKDSEGVYTAETTQVSLAQEKASPAKAYRHRRALMGTVLTFISACQARLPPFLLYLEKTRFCLTVLEEGETDEP